MSLIFLMSLTNIRFQLENSPRKTSFELRWHRNDPCNKFDTIYMAVGIPFFVLPFNLTCIHFDKVNSRFFSQRYKYTIIYIIYYVIQLYSSCVTVMNNDNICKVLFLYVMLYTISII